MKFDTVMLTTSLGIRCADMNSRMISPPSSESNSEKIAAAMHTPVETTSTLRPRRASATLAATT